MGMFKDSTINPLPSDLDHDPLCPPGIKPPPDKCMTCLFIEQVRRDEKQKWNEGLDAAWKAVNSCHIRLDNGEILRQGGDWEHAIDKACRAIHALREQR